MLDWEDEGRGMEAAVPVPPRAPGMHCRCPAQPPVELGR